MDITTKLENYTFFDFDKFRDDITKHFKDNAKIIGLTENQVVSHTSDKTYKGLVVEVYLDSDNPLISENPNQLPLLEQMFFSVDVVLLGEGKADSDKAYKTLVKRTQKLAVICQYLNSSLKSDYGCTFKIGTKVNTFTAVLDGYKSSDNIHNACKIFGWILAYRKKAL